MNVLRLDQEVDGQKTTLLVAAGSDTLLGSVELLFWQRGQRPREPRRSACIRMLFVHTAFRYQGVGRQLVDEACEIARHHGCEALGLCLAADNQGGRLFYEKLGFQFAYEYDDGSFVVTKRLSESL